MTNYFIPEKNNISTIINDNTSLVGDLSFATSLEIRGKFKGTIRSKGLLVIGKNAIVEADIYSYNLVIEGQVKGDILVYNKLEVEEFAKIEGNIKTYKIKVTDGMFFEGECQTLPQEELEKEFEKSTKDIKNFEAHYPTESEAQISNHRRMSKSSTNQEKTVTVSKKKAKSKK